MKLKTVIISVSAVYIACYAGLRATDKITHFPNISEAKGHSIICKPDGWEGLMNSFDEDERNKISIINKVFYPLRKLEEIFWDVVD